MGVCAALCGVGRFMRSLFCCGCLLLWGFGGCWVFIDLWVVFIGVIGSLLVFVWALLVFVWTLLIVVIFIGYYGLWLMLWIC